MGAGQTGWTSWGGGTGLNAASGQCPGRLYLGCGPGWGLGLRVWLPPGPHPATKGRILDLHSTSAKALSLCCSMTKLLPGAHCGLSGLTHSQPALDQSRWTWASALPVPSTPTLLGGAPLPGVPLPHPGLGHPRDSSDAACPQASDRGFCPALEAPQASTRVVRVPSQPQLSRLWVQEQLPALSVPPGG